MKKYILRRTLVVLVIAVFISSCKKNVPAGGTAMEKLAGDWFVKVNDKSGFYWTIYTYNTSDNSSVTMWLETTGLTSNNIHVNTDPAKGPVKGLPIGFKGKVSVDVGAQSFSANNVANVNANTAVTAFSIANGKVISNGTVGPVSNTPADLITFDLIVNGVTYKVSGYHKTGFISDEPPGG